MDPIETASMACIWRKLKFCCQKVCLSKSLYRVTDNSIFLKNLIHIEISQTREEASECHQKSLAVKKRGLVPQQDKRKPKVRPSCEFNPSIPSPWIHTLSVHKFAYIMIPNSFQNIQDQLSAQFRIFCVSPSASFLLAGTS